MHRNDKREKLYSLGDFENETPTHIDATYAFSKFDQKFQIRIPKEFDKKIWYPQNQNELLIHFQFLDSEKSTLQKSYPCL